MTKVNLHSTNRINSNKKHKLTTSYNTPQQELNKNDNKKLKLSLATLGIGGAVITAIAIGKYNKAQKLADSIDFKPAKTLQEAKEFAHKHLKIKKFELTDLDSANYINEALVNYNNNISSNHKKIVNSVKPTTANETGIASITWLCGFGGFLEFNEKQFNNLDNLINNFFNKHKSAIEKSDFDLFNFTEKQNSLISKFFDKFAMTKKEKLQFLEFSQKLNNIKNIDNPSACFVNLISDNEVLEIFKKNNLPTTLDEFSKLDSNNQRKIITDLMRNYNKKFKVQDGGPFQTINHEIGHVLHNKNIGSKKYSELIYHQGKSKEEIEKGVEKFSSQIGEDKIQAISGNITKYATTSPAEFVAETYSHLCNGGRFSNEIMDLYKKFGGVVPNNCAI